MGLRLQLRRAQARAGDVALLFGDESEALTHPYLAHAWAERGAELRVQAPGQARKVALLDATSRTALVHTSPTKRSGDFVALLEQLDRAYGPVPGQARTPVVLVLDNGAIHTSKATATATATALAARPGITVEWLPRYAPELNAIEGTWRDLKRHHLAHRTFRNAGDLDRAIHHAVAALNKERAVVHPCLDLPRAA